MSLRLKVIGIGLVVVLVLCLLLGLVVGQQENNKGTIAESEKTLEEQQLEIKDKLVNTEIMDMPFDYNLGQAPALENVALSGWYYDSESNKYNYKYTQGNVEGTPFFGMVDDLVMAKDNPNLSVSASFRFVNKDVNELYGKVGYVFTNSQGNGLFIYLDAQGTAGENISNITGTKICYVKIVNGEYDWDTVVIPSSDRNYYSKDVNVKFKVIREGSVFKVYLYNYELEMIDGNSYGINESEPISPSIRSFNVGLEVSDLVVYKYLNVGLQGANLYYDDHLNLDYIYSVEKHKDYRVIGLEEGVSYNYFQEMRGSLLRHAYVNKVDKMKPTQDFNKDTAVMLAITRANFGDDTYKYLAGVSEFYSDEDYNVDFDTFRATGDLGDNKGTYWYNDKAELCWVWRTNDDLILYNPSTYFTMVFIDNNDNIGSINFAINSEV